MNNYSRQLAQLEAAHFYGILDTGYVDQENWIQKFDSLHQGGAKIIQVRAKKESPSQRTRLLEIVLARLDNIAAEERPIIIVNDDIELCLEYEALGLHIGQDDTPPREARQRLGPERILGLSTHSTAQAQSAMDLGPSVLSYFAVGPLFATQTKPDYTPVGLELGAWVAMQTPTLPFYCIGGINRANAQQVRDAGINRVVTVSDVLLDSDTAQAVSETTQYFL